MVMCFQPLLEAPVEEVDEGPPEWVSFFKPNVTINLVDDFTRFVNMLFLARLEFYTVVFPKVPYSKY